MLCSSFTVDSPNVSVADGVITSNYAYQTTRVAVAADGSARVTPVEQRYVFKTQTKVPKLGMMLVGWGGNNGSTVTAGILANIHKMSWPTREGTRFEPPSRHFPSSLRRLTPLSHANYYGSLLQCSTVKVGHVDGKDVFVPMSALLPMVTDIATSALPHVSPLHQPHKQPPFRSTPMTSQSTVGTFLP